MEHYKREFRIKWPKDQHFQNGVHVNQVSEPKEVHNLKIVNFSRHGMFLESESDIPFQTGSELHFNIPEKTLKGTPSDSSVSGVAIVKWVRRAALGPKYPKGIGVSLSKFKDLSYLKYRDVYYKSLYLLKVKDLFQSAVPSVFLNTNMLTALAVFQGFKTDLLVVLDDHLKPVGMLPVQKVIEKLTLSHLESQIIGSLCLPIHASVTSEEGIFAAVKLIKEGARFDIPVIDDGIYRGVLPLNVVIKFWAAYNDHYHERIISQQESAIAEVAHELRTPVTYLAGIFHMLKSGDLTLDEIQKADLAVAIDQNLTQLQLNIDELLDPQRMKRGQVVLREKQENIFDLLQQILKKSEFLYNAKGVSIILLGSDGILHSFIDSRRFEQIVTNLLNNALKFSSSGGKVFVTVEVGLDDYKISVKDQGCGIHPDVMKAIIDENNVPFLENLHDNDNTGIGLSIVKKIIKAMNGKLEVHSIIGCGAQFSVTLPINKKQTIKT